MKVNFFGDFVTNDILDNVVIDEKLNSILQNATFNICNFEGPIESSGQPINKSGPSLQINKTAPHWLLSKNFKLITLANNHIMDYGETGLNATLKACQEMNVIGAGTWADAYRPYILNIEGKRIAFFSFTHCEFGTLTDPYDSKNTKGAAWINHDSIDFLIKETRKNVDYIIALPHGGYEYLEQPLPEWRTRYKALLDMGCDAIIASHPHIIQGIEIYKNKPIFYSLGNFFFPTSEEKNSLWYYSLCIEISIGAKLEFKATPIFFSNNKIAVCNQSDSIFSYISKINNVLSNNCEYLSYINTQCDLLLDRYYPRLKKNQKKRFCEMLLEKRGLTIHPLDNQLADVLFSLNNYRCESHRWCIARGLKNRYGIQ